MSIFPFGCKNSSSYLERENASRPGSLGAPNQRRFWLDFARRYPNIVPMTLTQLNYIVAVAQHRSFLKAADACHVTQPTLSQQIQKLEAELGVQIFDRQNQPVTTTLLGEKIIAQALVTLKES